MCTGFGFLGCISGFRLLIGVWGVLGAGFGFWGVFGWFMCVTGDFGRILWYFSVCGCVIEVFGQLGDFDVRGVCGDLPVWVFRVLCFGLGFTLGFVLGVVLASTWVLG